MQSIEKLDPNFLAPEVQRDGLCWHDVRCAPFALYGLLRQESDAAYCRMPRALAASLSPTVAELNEHTAGIRLRFRTDSPYVAVHAEVPGLRLMSHMPLTGSSGFDVYADGRFAGIIRPDHANGTRVDGIVLFEDARPREIQINFPLYNPVGKVFVGLDESASLSEGAPYRHSLPAVFYGSSITQGGCASRPGNCYQAHLSRWLDLDYINLGFSGNAKGELAMAHYIASLPMSVFVMDYDHNAPTLEHLESTHAPFFRAVRERHPELPIVIVSKPDRLDSSLSVAAMKQRRDVLLETYREAKAGGDRNVYFVDGGLFYPDSLRDSCSVDGCHPNDLGFFFMAAGLEEVLRRVLGEAGPLLSALKLPFPLLEDKK